LHHAITAPYCPVKVCVTQALHLLTNKADNETLICAFCKSPGQPFRNVSSADIVAAVKLAIDKTEAATMGYTAERMGSHSLCAGGAMALFSQGCDEITIKNGVLDEQCLSHVYPQTTQHRQC